MNNKWTILYCKRHDGFSPHINAIQISNPEHQLLVLNTSNNYPPKKAWMECDLILRPHIKQILPEIQYNNIALLEWDVLLLDNLPDINITNALYADQVYYQGGPWIPTAMRYFINTEYEKFVVCAARFCFYFMPKSALEIWTDPANDKWFDKSMSCEVRLPTLCRKHGIEPKRFKSINKPYLISGKHNIPKICGKNIYHPILTNLSNQYLDLHFYPDIFDNIFNIKSS